MIKAKRTREKKVFPVYSYGHLARLHLHALNKNWSMVSNPCDLFSHTFLNKIMQKFHIFQRHCLARKTLFHLCVCMSLRVWLLYFLFLFQSFGWGFFCYCLFFVFFFFSSNKSNLIALQWCTYWAVLRSYPIEEKQPQKKWWIVSIESIAFIALVAIVLKTTTCRIIYILFSNFLHE